MSLCHPPPRNGAARLEVFKTNRRPTAISTLEREKGSLWSLHSGKLVAPDCSQNNRVSGSLAGLRLDFAATGRKAAEANRREADPLLWLLTEAAI